jgi:predicted methyltransferase
MAGCPAAWERSKIWKCDYKTDRIVTEASEQYISEGDIVIDATAGNGRDTLALAKLAGSSGKVYAFDIQESAIKKTRTLLEKEGLLKRCELIQGSHLRIKELIPESAKGKIAAVVFNLGYLPGGGKEVVTQAETTLPAVVKALDLIRPGGIIAVTMYSGHPKGAEEKTALLRFAGQLRPKGIPCRVYLFHQSAQPTAVELLLISKKMTDFSV